MNAVRVVFMSVGAVLWLSAFGYLVVLRIIARRRTPSPIAESLPPRVAVVVPTLNEERFIAAKIRDLARTDYPPDLVSIVVVDGGSSDGTVSLAEKEAERDRTIRVVRLARVPSKTDQIRQALEAVTEEFVIFTDADSLLAPSCVPRLVDGLLNGPQTALLGAAVRPATALLEERLHWWFLNYVWWLEGQALGAAMFSAVCYGVRRSALLPLLPRLRAEKADDVHLAHLLAGEGLEVRLCRAALAAEVRVPRTRAELLEFRNRRGTKYVRTLRSVRPGTAARRGVRMVRAARLWHFLVSPALAVLLAVAAAGLIVAGDWLYPALLAAAFVVPALAAVFSSTALGERGWGRCRLALAGVRLVVLTWLSLLRIGRSVRPCRRLAAGKETR
jgi:glycosyltransferase involved in cell wall biosynthesis